MSNFRPGDWNCAQCGNHNFASKGMCNKCHAPKTGAFGMAAPQFQQMQHMAAPQFQQMQHMAAPQFQNQGGFGKAPIVKQPMARALPYGKGQQQPKAAAANGMRPGDWCCPLCGNHNYANKQVCGKSGCNQPCVGGGGSANMRPGDWKCFGCSNVNYANRTECNKCKIPKDVYIAKTGMKHGDWICASCTNHNFASKTECNKCGTVKSPQTVHHEHTENMRPGDWTCAQCNNHNFADKQVCNKCSAKKQQR